MNTANHIPQDDLALFALQFLPEQEMTEATEHLKHCEACREEVARYQGDLATYAMTSEMHSPPASARERLLRRVAKEKKVLPMVPKSNAQSADVEPQLAPRSSRLFEMESYEEAGRRGPGFMTWAGWAIAAGVAVVAGLQYHQRETLQSDLNAVSARLTQTTGEADHAKDALQTLTDAGAVQMTLRLPVPPGQTAVHTPEGHAAYIPEKGALVFMASNLEQLQPYKTYELWVLPMASGADAVPAGIFKPDLNGNASVVMPDLPKGVQAKGFAVTIEDDGGTKQPTLPIVLVGM